VEKASGVKLRVVDGARRAGDAVELVAQSSKIKGALGWRPQHEEIGVICSTAHQWEAKLRGSRSDRGKYSEKSA
jgi:UDP-glucose 4-epimerase